MKTERLAIVIIFVTGATALACSRADQVPQDPTSSLDEVAAVALGTDVWLVDMFGNDAVGHDIEGELWLVNVRAGESNRLTDDGHPKHHAALSADYVVWIDQRKQIPLSGYRGPVFAADVFVRNRDTAEERRIADGPATRKGLRASGSRLVWQHNRKGLLEGRRRDFDIYVYDLEQDVEIPIVVAPCRQETPAIHGDMVVWSDNRNRPEDTPSRAGCSNCPDNPFDIYLYNLETAEERPLAAQEGTGHVTGPGSDGSQRCKDGFAGTRSLDVQRAQHARRIAPEPGPALNHVSQGIGGHRVAELRRRSDNAFELLPAAGSRDGLFKGRATSPFASISAAPRILKASKVSCSTALES